MWTQALIRVMKYNYLSGLNFVVSIQSRKDVKIGPLENYHHACGIPSL